METTTVRRGEATRRYAPTDFDRAYARAVRGSRILSGISTRVDLPETIQLPVDGPVIICANHSSLFDLVASLITLDQYGITARIGVNERFFGNPVAGRFLRGIGCIPFSRERREEAEDTMVAALEDGQACALMPEGRITRPEDQVNGVGPARPGISRITRRTGAALIPVGFGHADRAWKPGKPLPRVANRSRPIVARIGEPFAFDSDDHEANAALLMDRIGDLVVAARAA